jgi:cytochrome P450
MMRRPADLVLGPDIYADLRRLADSAPIVQVMLHGRVPAYLLTRPDDIANAAVDPRLTSDDSFLRTGTSSVKFGFMGLDGAAHARLRRSATSALSPQRIRALRPYLRRITDEAVDVVLPAGRADLVTDIALPIAMRVICELLGVPFAERHDFESMANQMLLPVGDNDPVAARGRLFAYLTELVRQERRSGVAGDLTEQETVETLALLLVAGYQTTADLIGSAMLALIEHPEQLRVLRDGVSTPDRAVGELIRYCGPMAIGVTRYTREAVVLAGTTVPAGERVVLGLGSANRDPARFPDPDRLDLTRAPAGHFSFGRGPHYCLGAALAQLEVELVITTLCRRLPRLRLAGQPTWRTTIFTGVDHLPVAFESS